ncbi:MAG: hypothetical protein CL666_08390 [Balneola sp.]|nr:hypothetical protein [Balneola sp.]|tara:strand:- start:36978 stop:40814 length:3837 start_codon:yes stop_codon:yes gene_type:complete
MKKATVFKSLLLGIAASIFLVAQPALAQDNIIMDGDFSSGELAPAWINFQGEGATADFSVTDGQATVTNVTTAGSPATWHLQFIQEFSAEQIGMLVAGESYRISFDAQSSIDGRPFRLYFGENGGSFTSFFVVDSVANTEMQTYEFEFTLSQTVDPVKFAFELGLSDGDFTVDNIVLESAEANLGPEILVNGDFSTGELAPEWTNFQGEGATADFGVTDGQATVTNATITESPATWHLQFIQEFSAEQLNMLVAGESYVISFDAQSNVDGRPFRLYFGENGGSFTSFFVVDSVANTEMQTYEFEFNLSQTVDPVKFAFELGLSADDFIVDNMSLKQVGVEGGGSGDVKDMVSLPVSFEDTASVDYALTDFGNNVSEIVVDPTDDENLVAKSVKTDSAQTWAGTTIGGAAGFTAPVPFSEFSTVMTIRVWSPAADVPVRLKVEDAADANISVETEVNTTVAEGWETLEFDFTNQVEGTAELNTANVYSKASIFFNFGTAGADAGEQTYYWDDVTFIKNDPPNPPFGDNKILFVDGPNVLVPSIDGTVVEDVIEEDNLVHRLGDGGAFFELGYFWDMGGSGGVDFSQNMADVDTVYLRIRINPADHTDAEGVLRATGSLMLADVTNGTNSDLQWGIAYPLGEYYDNEWHELAIPLPKPTIAEHDSALKGLDLNGDPLPASEQYSEEQEKWTFPTAWNGSMDVSPNDSTLGGDPEWGKLGRIAFRLGNNQSGAFYVDDFFIGSRSETDLSVATALPDLPGNVVSESSQGEVNISWDHDVSSNIFNYELYYSGSEIESIEDEGVKFIGSFRTSDALSYTHEAELPHPSVSGVEYHYAVVPTTQYSIKSPTNFTASNVTATGDVMPYIFELSTEQEEQIISDLESGEINLESWPTDDFKPFLLSEEGIDQTDASAQVWMAFGRAEGLQTMYIFVEAYDDDILAGPTSAPTDMFGTTVYPRENQDPNTFIPGVGTGDLSSEFSDGDLEWNYYLKDQLKIHFGTYDVDFATGTTNEFRSRGDKPDYFLSLQPKMSSESTDPGPDGMLTRFWVTEHNTEDPDKPYNTLYYNSEHQFTFTSLYENIVEGESRVGWRAVTAFDVNDLLVATDDSGEPIDEPLVLPEKNALKYIPLSFELYDKDSGDGGNWWENPSHVITYPSSLAGGFNYEGDDNITMLGSAAIAGSDLVTSNEQFVDTPLRFNLDQNYPNPFNPTTKIGFTLPSSQKVQLSIYNILGQRVATLIDGQQMTSGAHTVNFDASMFSSGLYIYRIEAGKFSSSKKMMLIK